MYPPNAQYTRLPTDPEDPNGPAPLIKTRLTHKLRPFLRPIYLIRLIVFLSLSFLGWTFVRRSLRGPSKPAFTFDQDPRPSWLDTSLSEPLRLRVAVISRASEFKVRMAMRESVFRGVRESDVSMDARFFVGAPTGIFSWFTQRKLTREMETNDDIVFLKDIDDTKQRLSEKRFAAVKWVSSSLFGYRRVVTYYKNSGGICSPRKLRLVYDSGLGHLCPLRCSCSTTTPGG